MQDLYALDVDQRRRIERLCTVATLIAAGLPENYTSTPAGSLADVSQDVADMILFAKPMGTCDECGAAPVPTIRCEECDTHRCHRCYYAHKH